METKLMYRCSEFTKNPRGKLCLTLLNTNKDLDYTVEFCLNNQRVQPDLMLKDLNIDKKVKEFAQNKTSLHTYSTKDVLIIKIMDLSGQIIGYEYRDISSLYLTNSDVQTN
jgi:hypothetical protein